MLQTDIEDAAGLPAAVELGKLLSESHGGEVIVMDMRKLNFWTDFFVIATVTSSVHLSGMERHVKDYALERGLEILHRSRRPENEDEWCLLDLGGIVVHLMTAKTRAFYELERLWSAASILYNSNETASGESHSSKSS
jgi:ribosome-associated protein